MIRISSSFDGGNIHCETCTDSSDIRLQIKADAAADFSQWFYFRLTGGKGLPCVMKITNADKASYVKGWEGYQAVGMSQSFKKPANAKPFEKFGETFFHEPSQRFYQIDKRDDKLFFRRFQHDLNGELINEIEIPIDWILGSGNRTRSYLYQTKFGEMFQLPIGWYSEGDFWEMSPGFESGNHDGISRRVKRECMFCHNAFPEVEKDAYGDADLFPQHLPEGTG